MFSCQEERIVFSLSLFLADNHRFRYRAMHATLGGTFVWLLSLEKVSFDRPSKVFKDDPLLFRTLQVYEKHSSRQQVQSNNPWDRLSRSNEGRNVHTWRSSLDSPRKFRGCLLSLTHARDEPLLLSRHSAEHGDRDSESRYAHIEVAPAWNRGGPIEKRRVRGQVLTACAR